MSEPTKIYAVQFEDGQPDSLWSTSELAKQRLAYLKKNWADTAGRAIIVVKFLDEEIFLETAQPTIESREQSDKEFNAWRDQEIAKAEAAPYDPASNRLEWLKKSAWSAGLIRSFDEFAEQWKSGKLTAHKS